MSVIGITNKSEQFPVEHVEQWTSQPNERGNRSHFWNAEYLNERVNRLLKSSNSRAKFFCLAIWDKCISNVDSCPNSIFDSFWWYLGQSCFYIAKEFNISSVFKFKQYSIESLSDAWNSSSFFFSASWFRSLNNRTRTRLKFFDRYFCRVLQPNIILHQCHTNTEVGGRVFLHKSGFKCGTTHSRRWRVQNCNFLGGLVNKT